MKLCFSLPGIAVNFITASKFIIVSKKVIRLIVLFVLPLFMQKLNAQPWIENLSKGDTNFYDIQKAYYDYSKKFKEENPGAKDGTYKKFKRWEWFMESRVYPSGDITLPSKNWEKYQNYLNSFQYKGEKGNSTLGSAAGNWISLGPDTAPSNFPVGYGGVGRIDFIRFDPTNANIMWAGAPSGGLWKSTNGGISWTTNTDFLTVIGCSDLVIDPTNTNIMYLATGDRDHFATNSIGVLKSSDGGVTWNPTGLSRPISAGYRIHKLLMHPTNPSIILVAANFGIYKTTDAGVTWILTQTGNFSDMEFKPGTPATLYAVTKSNGLFYKSTNTGGSFVNISSGLPAATEVDRYAIAVTPANPDYVYVLAVDNTNNRGFYGIYRSTNSGTNFSTRSTSPDIIGGNGWYNLSIAINPLNANDVYAGGIYQYRSADGGLTWSGIFGTHFDSHALEFLPGSSTTIFSGNDGGIYKTTDNGTSWNDISNGLAISQIYRMSTSATNPTLNLTGLQDNGTDRLNNNSWTWVFGGDGMECIIDYTNPDIMYAGVQNGRIEKSTDGSTSFSTIVNDNGSGIDAPGAWITPYIMHPTDNNTLLVGKDQVYRSTNGGLNWTPVGSISADPYMRALAYAPSNPNYIYAAFSYQFFSTTDGNSFTDRTGTLPVGAATITYIAVSNTNPNKVWVTFSGYADGEKVYMSNDAGVTWTNYSAGLPNLPANCMVYQNGSNDALYVGTDIGVYYRNNTMSSWQPFFDGLPNVIVNELEIHYGAGKIRAATYGRGLWESDLASSCTVPTYIWTGAVSTAWENPANWSCGILPDANSDVIINSGTAVLNSNTTIRSFTANPGVNFTVNPGYTLTIDH